MTHLHVMPRAVVTWKALLTLTAVMSMALSACAPTAQTQNAGPPPPAVLVDLLNGSPLLKPERGVEDEARYVARVRAVVSAPSGAQIQSADEAMAALQFALRARHVTMHVQTTPPGMRVEYKQFLFRNDSTVLWTPIVSDTTVEVAAAAYRIRYRPLRSSRDSVVDIPCADGCRVP